MNTLPITTAICGFALGLLLATQCNTDSHVVIGSDTSRTITTPPAVSITNIKAAIKYDSSTIGNRKIEYKYVRVPVYVHDTTPGRIDSVVDSVVVLSQCEHCRFTATSDSIITAHGDKMILRYRFPDNMFDVPYFQPAPDTSITITSHVMVRKNFAAVLGFYGGYDLLTKNISAGIAVTIGLQLPEF